MGNSTSTIELNGKRYDTQSGKVVEDTQSNQPNTVKPVASKHKRQEPGLILDGFVRRPPARHVQSGTNTTSNAPSAKFQEPKTSVKNAKQRLEKSRTLMRPAVKKPHIVKNDIQPLKSGPRLSVERTARMSRAENTEKSPHISRFGGIVNTITKKEAELPVVAPSFAALSKNVSNELNKLENALIDANSHLHQLEEHAVKKVPFLNRVGFKNRFANIATLSCALLLLAGFFGYQNSAAISMKVAASRAGVDAQLPGYKPAGFGMDGGVKSEPGKVSVSFKSRTDDKHFTVSQQASSWNSASLLANHVTKEHCDTCFQTWQNDGKTVYIYDNSNATWVNGGVWYKVEGNADLTSDQLLRLANSL